MSKISAVFASRARQNALLLIAILIVLLNLICIVWCWTFDLCVHNSYILVDGLDILLMIASVRSVLSTLCAAMHCWQCCDVRVLQQWIIVKIGKHLISFKYNKISIYNTEKGRLSHTSFVCLSDCDIYIIRALEILLLTYLLNIQHSTNRFDGQSDRKTRIDWLYIYMYSGRNSATKCLCAYLQQVCISINPLP